MLQNCSGIFAAMPHGAPLQGTKHYGGRAACLTIKILTGNTQHLIGGGIPLLSLG